MKSYEFHSHTADVRMEVRGDSFPELFTAALEGMAELEGGGAGSTKDIPSRSSYVTRISLSSQNLTFLLIDFLSAVLAQSHIHKVIFKKVKFRKLAETELEAEVEGAKVQEFEEDVKAVTYHEAEIRKKKGIYETTLVFDI